MRFFFDRNMPHRLARMIDVFETEHTIQHHDDDPRFNQTTTDIEWLSVLNEDAERWVIVSCDGRILKNKAESQKLRGDGIHLLLSRRTVAPHESENRIRLEVRARLAADRRERHSGHAGRV